jgi:DHA1 family multidrug resistance protein-like MFS transporter
MAITRTNRSEIRSILTRTSTAAYTLERFKVEQAISAEKTKSIAIAPTKTRDGVILVDWYTTDDPSNPQNWPASKKGWVLTQLCFYSMAVYGASSMYVPGEEGVMQKFKVGATPAALGLAMYVVGVWNWSTPFCAAERDCVDWTQLGLCPYFFPFCRIVDPDRSCG